MSNYIDSNVCNIVCNNYLLTLCSNSFDAFLFCGNTAFTLMLLSCGIVTEHAEVHLPLSTDNVVEKDTGL